MTLLVQIQEEAAGSSVDLSTLLRKLQLYAARVGIQAMERWVRHESVGYPDDADLPDYRVWPMQLVGNFAGGWGSSMSNAPIPLVCLPEGVRPRFREFRCQASVGSVEATVKGSRSGAVKISVGDLAVVLGPNVYSNMNCLQAWAEFSIVNFSELLHIVRGRVLELSIAYWREFPEAEATAQHSSWDTGERGRMTQIFNTIVSGGSANVVGTATGSTIVATIQQNDVQGLLSALGRAGIEPAALDELREALSEEPVIAAPGRFGPRVSAWIAKAVGNAASGAWNVGVGAAGALLAEAISKFYGA